MNPSETIELTVNGKPVQLASGATLDVLIQAHLGLEGAVPPGMPVAAEVNAEIVTRAAWGDRVLQGGDSVEIIGAQGGG